MKYLRKFKLNESYYNDLTSYGYGRPGELHYLNIGWLDNTHDFPIGDVPEGFIDKLNSSRNINARHKGFHVCEICRNARSSQVYQLSHNDKVYVFPDMLEHYITIHKYKPPQEFIDAVMNAKENIQDIKKTQNRSGMIFQQRRFK